MIYLLKRFWYALCCAHVGWRAHKAIHDLAQHPPYVTSTALVDWLQDAEAKLATTKEDRDVEEWLGGGG